MQLVLIWVSFFRFSQGLVKVYSVGLLSAIGRSLFGEIWEGLEKVYLTKKRHSFERLYIPYIYKD